MKSLVITLLTAAAFFLSPVVQASAVTPDQPHDFTCATCHSPHKTLGSTGYDNICLNCHRGGDPRAGAKSFAPGDAADPFGRYTSGVSNRFQISHRWDGSDTNVRAGAAPPVQASMTGVRGRTSGSLACVRCHNPHSQGNRPFLRMANDADQMCMDCHSSRNTTNQTKGTHPVGIDYQQKAAANPSAFNTPPVNANPSNPTSAMKLPGGKVSCSSCHGVHATDSNSSTFDSFSTLSDLQPSDGSLLRTDRRAATADGINICTGCHAGKVAHNGRGQNIQCGDCHGAHVDLGNGSVPNVWLVKRDMGPGRGQVFFNSTTVKNYMSSDGSGVCQPCHDGGVPTGSGYQFHLTETNATCNNCHAHGNSIGSFSVDPSQSCNTCHGYPPMANNAGAGGYASGYLAAPSYTDESLSGHASHASAPYQKACISCHQGNSHQTGTFQDVFIDTTGTIAATGGLTPTYNAAAQTCSTVYCHSNANPRGGANSTKTTPSWNGGKGTIIGTAGECGTCHSAAGDSLPTWSASHTKHINGYAANPNFSCTVCHAGTASGNAAIFNNITARSLHTNGVKDVAFNSFTNGGTWDPASTACSNLYCHSNVQGGSDGRNAPTTFTPGLAWNGTAMTCGSCHAAMKILNNISTATGSHKLHVQVYSFDCSVCHGNGYSVTGNSVPIPTHVDGTINTGFTGTAANNGAVPSYNQVNNLPSDGYNNCSNIYCHSSVQGSGGVGAPTEFAAPVWGAQSVDCGSCHKNMLTNSAATGSHIKHAQTAGYGCPTCHSGAGKDPNPPFAATAKHADGTIEISFSGSAVGAVYSKGGSVTPGTGYGTCSTSTCHGQGTVTWGAAFVAPGNTFPYSTSQCDKCHSGTATAQFYSTAIPKVTSNADAKVGAHTAHLTTPDVLATPLACADCHGTVTLNSATHMKGSTSFVWSTLATTGGLTPSYNPTTGVCSNVYCHGAKMSGGDTSGTNISPTWNVPFLPATLSAAACGSCHGFPPSTASGHPAITLPTGFPTSASIGNTCSCHANINTAGTSYATMFVNKALHINGTLEVPGAGSCDSCHGYPPASAGFVGAQSNWSSAKNESYLGGGGAHTIQNHVSKLAKPSEGFANCTKCHDALDHNMGATFSPSQSIKISVSQRYRFEAAKLGKYTSNRLDGVGHLTGTCSNISCHFGATPKWDPSH